jgi:hypothetical protein
VNDNSIPTLIKAADVDGLKRENSQQSSIN